jgi:DNA-binding XRE family transcriptional regulator
MLAVVKTPHIKIHIQGRIPARLMNALKKEYGKGVKLVDEAEDDDELVDVFQTDWYRRTKARLTPGKSLRIYRQNAKMTQDELGKRLGGLPKQFVSNMENGIRPISKNMALKLASIFKTSVARFIG